MKTKVKKSTPQKKTIQVVLNEADHKLFLEVVKAITEQENKPNKTSLFLKEKFFLPVLKEARLLKKNKLPLTDIALELPF